MKFINMKRIIKWVKSLFKEETPDFSIDHLKYLAFYKSTNPDLVKGLVSTGSLGGYPASVMSEASIVEDEWHMINWSRLRLPAKKRIIEMAKQDIAEQVNQLDLIRDLKQN